MADLGIATQPISEAHVIRNIRIATLKAGLIAKAARWLYRRYKHKWLSRLGYESPPAYIAADTIRRGDLVYIEDNHIIGIVTGTIDDHKVLTFHE